MHSQGKASPVTGHSIWLIPSPISSLVIEQMINELSEQFNTPLFQPHLTLLGQIPEEQERILPVFHELAQSCSPITLKPRRLDMQETFYRSLYYEIIATPELTAMNDVARSLFNQDSADVFFPHISLLYGFIPASAKRKIIRAFQPPDEITLDSIVLMRTQGEVKDWEHIESVELK